MQTRVFTVGLTGDAEAIAAAAEVIRAGGLVAFPTETVYGLGADALHADAVRRIYAAKGRPARNPVIVHVASIEQAKTLVTEWPSAAQILAERFWPGPLTMILPKRSVVPDVVSGGGSTVALRMPSHPIARRLIEQSGCPIAAPSANPSETVSATTAAHVLKGLNGKIDMVLDGGATTGGLESTVIDLSADPPVLRRPGLVTREQVSAVISLAPPDDQQAVSASEQPLASPGMLTRHYAPKIPLTVVSALPVGLNENCAFLLCGVQSVDSAPMTVCLPADPAGYAAGLYDALHRLEDSGAERIYVQEPPMGDAWEAVHDRLKRASSDA